MFESCVEDKLVGHNFLHISILWPWYCQGSKQGRAYALSWHSYLALCQEELTFDHQKHVLLGPNCIWLMVTTVDVRASTNSIIFYSSCNDLIVDYFIRYNFNHFMYDCVSCSRWKCSYKYYNQFSWLEFSFSQKFTICLWWSFSTPNHTTLIWLVNGWTFLRL